jgi:hypothetical protein
LEKPEVSLKAYQKDLDAVENNIKDLALVDSDDEEDVIPITTRERDLTLTLVHELRKVCEGAKNFYGSNSE